VKKVLLSLLLVLLCATNSMAQDTYIGEIRMFAGNFAPAGWAFCDGQLLSINENTALFSLIGTTYGGDGQSTFAVPDLRGRAPVHIGQGSDTRNIQLGEMGGAETVTLTAAQLPAHSHQVEVVTGKANASTGSSGSYIAVGEQSGAAVKMYKKGTTADVPLAPSSVGATGGSQPHNNMMPYQCIHYIISLSGIYPSPN
jgi:microcystin-dependent protein